MPQPQQLPGPNADMWDWQMHGTCRGVDSAVFFHPDGERGRARAQREMRAKEMCRACPVITQCRSHALAVGEPYGIWGGLSEGERELLLKRGIRRASQPSVRLTVFIEPIGKFPAAAHRTQSALGGLTGGAGADDQ